MTLGRVEHPAIPTGNSTLQPQPGAKSGADSGNAPISDPDLAHVIASWPSLSPDIKRVVLTIIDGLNAQKGG